MTWVQVWNKSKLPVTIRENNGDSVTVMARSKAKIGSKFLKNIPASIKVLDMHDSLKDDDTDGGDQ